METLPSPAQPKRIVLIKPSSFGDVIHALPSAASIRAAHPTADIRWVINPEWAPLLEGNPHINGVLHFPSSRVRGPWAPFVLFSWIRREIRPFKPDVAIDLQGLLRTGLIAALSGAGRTIGPHNAREGASLLYRERAKVDPAVHAVERSLQVVDKICDGKRSLEFPLPKASLEGLDPLPREPFIVLHPYARGVGKALAPASVAAFCQAAAPIPVVIVGRGTPTQTLGENVRDYTNRTDISSLIGILRAATVVVSVDSGPMHLAAALGKPLIGIYTWSDPRKVGPFLPFALVWQNGAIHTMESFLAGGRTNTPGPAPTPVEAARIASRAAGLLRACVAGEPPSAPLQTCNSHSRADFSES